MNADSTRSTRRVLVIINNACLAAVFILWDVGVKSGWNEFIAAGAVSAFFIVALTFIILHVRSGLWKLTHANVQKLDEREIHLTHEALRHSYGIFTITCLAIIYFNILADLRSIDVVGAACMLYLAHTLPGSVIAWKEKNV